MNSPTLIIGNKNYSSWSLRPWLFLRKNEIEFREKILWLDEPGFKPAINPMGSGGKVPVLVESDTTLWDSLAIIETAIERYPCRYSWPDDPAQRAHARSISYEMHSSFAALRNECPMDIRATRHLELTDATLEDIERIEQIWAQALVMSGEQGRWLYGDFSAADAMFAPVVFRFQTYQVEVSPLLSAYMDYVLSDELLGLWISDAISETHQIDY